MSDNYSHFFEPPWWMKNAHLQSCLRTFIKPKSYREIEWEELNLPDGDFVDLCWAGPKDGPLVVLLHGLEGSFQSHYIQFMLRELATAGWHVVLMHFRSCSGRLNRFPHSYHASQTVDLDYLLSVLERRYPSIPICAVGFSLGGIVLIHHMVKSAKSPIKAAVSISIPYQMDKSADAMPSLYKWTLLRSMKDKCIQKIKAGHSMPATIKEIKQARGFREFDNLLTAPLNNFRDANDYYARSSVRPLLGDLHIPTLIIHAEDDPLIPIETIPTSSELASSIDFELCRWGGHVGFLQGRYPWRMEPWFRNRVLEFLKKSV